MNRPGLRAVFFDFGGVLTTSPFDAFGRYEAAHGLPDGFIRRVNATDPDANAWARLERGDLAVDAFVGAFEAECLALGHRVDGHDVLGCLRGDLRPEMVEAVRRCRRRFVTGCLTNNFGAEPAGPAGPADDDSPTDDGGPTDDGSSAGPDDDAGLAAVLDLFDVVVESRAAGVRKPERRFYELACAAAGVRPEEAAFLDDLGVNLKPAQAMGMHTIKVTDPGRALAELAAVTGLDLADLHPPPPP
ncbi:MAG TPA: HAD-IA family hydrolase [Acidimicrobiales bacterium]|nr:HAD-IA family hydrolase [Acidimicrobiales bacterium]